MSTKGGFYGKYGAPSLVDSAINGARRLRASPNEEEEPREARAGSRLLQTTTDVDYTEKSLRNPVMCLGRGDSMTFTIRDPRHYPVYLKDSVMNSNPSFDFGAFLLLADSMNNRVANNDTSVSLFAFTFTTAGSYVFVDASDYE